MKKLQVLDKTKKYLIIVLDTVMLDMKAAAEIAQLGER